MVLDESRTELDGLKRAQRVELLTAQAADQRRKILAALDAEGLAAEVEIAEPTGFSVLPIRATDRALQQIRSYPEVKDVLPISDSLSVET